MILFEFYELLGSQCTLWKGWKEKKIVTFQIQIKILRDLFLELFMVPSISCKYFKIEFKFQWEHNLLISGSNQMLIQLVNKVENQTFEHNDTYFVLFLPKGF